MRPRLKCGDYTPLCIKQRGTVTAVSCTRQQRYTSSLMYNVTGDNKTRNVLLQIAPQFSAVRFFKKLKKSDRGGMLCAKFKNLRFCAPRTRCACNERIACDGLLRNNTLSLNSVSRTQKILSLMERPSFHAARDRRSLKH